MSFSATDLTNIEAAIATGELKVEVDGKLVLYRSVAELIAARNLIRTELQISGQQTKAVRTSYASRVRN
jgi:hypothetical protein